MAKKRKTRELPTNRSGVVIANPAGDGEEGKEDDIEDWVDSAQSPHPMQGSNGGKRDVGRRSSPRSTSTARTTKKPKTVKTPKGTPEMTLPGADGDGDENDGDQEDAVGEGQELARVRWYGNKLKKAGAAVGGGTDMTSPSDLSRASTLPRTPFDSQEVDEEEKKGEEEYEDEIEKPLVAGDVDGVEQVAKSAAEATGDASEPLEAEVPGDDFPPGGDYGDDDDDGEGDDVAPPAHQDDYSDEEDEKPAASDEEKQKQLADVDGLDSDRENGEVGGGDYDDDDNRDDNDEEGPGFNMVHDPETPASVRKQRAQEEKEKMEQARKKTKSKKKRPDDGDNDEDDDDDESTIASKPKRGRKKREKKRDVVFSPKGIPSGNREYDFIPIGALVVGSPDSDEDGPRRSRRPKTKPLQFWRNEKMEYGAHDEKGELAEVMGDMPVVKGIQKAKPTPYKKRKGTGEGQGGGAKKKAGSKRAAVQKQIKEFDDRKLRKKYNYIDGTDASIWDDVADEAKTEKVVSYAADMKGGNLPLSRSRTKAEGKITGKAAQAFNAPTEEGGHYVGYIMGNLILPPKGIKDPESVGPCAQTFTVCRCQPKAMEVSFGDPEEPDGELDPETAQRFLLSPGDMFRVPPGNSYRLHNHSESEEALLTWTIIRPKEDGGGR